MKGGGDYDNEMGFGVDRKMVEREEHDETVEFYCKRTCCSCSEGDVVVRDCRCVTDVGVHVRVHCDNSFCNCLWWLCF